MNNLDSSRLTALRFAADAITSRPELCIEVFNYLQNLWNYDEILVSLNQETFFIIQNSKFDDYREKLYEAAERLIADNDSFKQNAGCALYSSILSRNWNINYDKIQKLLFDINKNKLVIQYRNFIR